LGSTAAEITLPLPRILNILTTRNLLSSAALARAEAAGGRVDRRLLDLGLISEDHMAQAYAEALGMPLLSADSLPQEPLFSDAANVACLADAKILPLAMAEGAVIVALSDPLDSRALKAASFLVQAPVRPAVMTASVLTAGLEKLYSPQDTSLPHSLPDLLEGDAERLRDLASEGPVVRLVTAILDSALAAGATDIHFEPMTDRLVIRYRVDGMLRREAEHPRRVAIPMITRVKVMAGLDIGERRLPQDGRIRQTTQGRDIDFRVSTTPGVHGEGVVLRVLDQQQAGARLEGLGLPMPVVSGLSAELERPHGILLVTGPTGSGKTTTLYAGLRRMDREQRKILTIEDPVEYMLDGINQIQVKPAIGLTFAHALRSFLRQDPDVILVGEIRDGETARVAIQAALTGHLVLSTLHTNDAAGAVPRLIDMGVDSYLLAATLSGILAQRLVRTLCQHCRQPYRLEQDDAQSFGFPEDATVYRAAGCPHCGGTGYRGRTAIGEWLRVDEQVAGLIRHGAPGAEIASAAQDMTPLFEDGLARVLAGETTLEEVLRVTRAG
jgi:general secretion pathway protein E